MTFQEYHEAVHPLASYPSLGNNLLYPALGIAGEGGEVADKVKKLWRNRGIITGVALDPHTRVELLKELGDVLWYIDAMATELESGLQEVAELNARKLLDRHARGVIKSEGDNR